MSEKTVDTDVDVVECPLCMESLDLDDLGFYPCSCGYQICRFCWHRLSNLEDNPESGEGSRGLCPACRQEYPESPVCFNSGLTIEAILEQNKNKKKKKKQNKQKQKQQEDKQKLKEILKQQEKNLSGLRVVQKNLVFLIGLPPRLSQEELRYVRREFAKYGKVHKLVVGGSASVNTAYITYTRPEDAVKAIQSVNNHNNGGNQFITRNGKNNTLTLRASLGTTKYCTHWLRNQQCPKLPDCMYLHELADSEASFTKEEMQKGKHTEYEKKLINQYLNRLKKNNESDAIEVVTGSLPKQADSGGQLNSLDEIIGSSSDSLSTSFSTCSSGSCPPSISSPNTDVEDVQKSETESSGVCMEDDGLDFDPISISTNGLQDLIRSSSDECCPSSTAKNYLPYNGDVEEWKNSFKALLPNVNITFANSSDTCVDSSRGGNMFKQSTYQFPIPPPLDYTPWYRLQNVTMTNLEKQFPMNNGGVQQQMRLAYQQQQSGARQPPPGFSNF
ncbi:CCR4-NOT transcription complex subunit 4-like isoform X5 [Leptotrombidium deliense]|uniref:CCR4-NOT transcription complex subunit 4-like isoform X5 n=1 Tax=Leptotrombidium deliense TaxID=299467 RepID=A0A443ST51_9ACAR|nr:CCR4-NOT transcription complex subunit 4-like isoform X5 [Leptotrombidium deliense]